MEFSVPRDGAREAEQQFQRAQRRLEEFNVVSTGALRQAALLPLQADAQLSKFTGHVSDSGEGRWTVSAAIDEGAPAPVLSAALFQRFSSRGEALFAEKLLSAMRYQFGGHVERPTGE